VVKVTTVHHRLHLCCCLRRTLTISALERARSWREASIRAVTAGIRVGCLVIPARVPRAGGRTPVVFGHCPTPRLIAASVRSRRGGARWHASPPPCKLGLRHVWSAPHFLPCACPRSVRHPDGVVAGVYGRRTRRASRAPFSEEAPGSGRQHPLSRCHRSRFT